MVGWTPMCNPKFSYLSSAWGSEIQTEEGELRQGWGMGWEGGRCRLCPLKTLHCRSEPFALQNCLALFLFSLMVGVYIGLSFSGFWNYNDTTWYNLTDMIYSQVGEGNSTNSAFIFSISFISTLDDFSWGRHFFLTFEPVVWFLPPEHTELSVVDMVLANHFLVILTSLGLFISGDLRYPSSSVLLVGEWLFS